MNKLHLDKQKAILTLLTEGNSIRAVERITGVTTKAVMRLLVNAGNKAKLVLDERLRNINAKFIQVDEIWTYVQKKQKNLTELEKEIGKIGDQYIYVAIDARTKLVLLFLVGHRTEKDAIWFMTELNKRLSERTRHRFQLTTDGFNAYPVAVFVGFKNVDYAQIRKEWAREMLDDRKYSTEKALTIGKYPFYGNPNPDMISTSYVERQNLTMRMHMRRLTRLTNGFSKKVENLEAAVALHFYYYNFMKTHSTLRMTPAMKARITTRFWQWEDLLNFN